MYRKYKRASYKRKRAIYRRRYLKRRSYRKRAYRIKPEVKQQNLIVRGNGTANDGVTYYSSVGKAIMPTPFTGASVAANVWVANNVIGITPQNRTTVTGSAAAWMPNIGQGTGQSSRIGNKIVFKGMKINLQVQPNPYSETFNPQPTPGILRVLIMSSKYRPTEIFNVDFLDDIFQLGNQTTRPQGCLQDAYTEINRDKYLVLRDFKFKVGYSMEQTFNNYDVLFNYQQFANTDFKYVNNKTFKLRKGIKKVFVFNDNSTETEDNLNRLWQMVFLWCPVSGGLIDDAILSPCSIQTNVRFYYVDP